MYLFYDKSNLGRNIYKAIKTGINIGNVIYSINCNLIVQLMFWSLLTFNRILFSTVKFFNVIWIYLLINYAMSFQYNNLPP